MNQKKNRRKSYYPLARSLQYLYYVGMIKNFTKYV